MTVFCSKCSMPVVVDEKLKVRKDGDFMIHGSCMECGSWLKWLPYSDSQLVKRALRLYSTLPEVQQEIIK